eukprot:5329515-Amphidinium_carterae.1
MPLSKGYLCQLISKPHSRIVNKVNKIRKGIYGIHRLILVPTSLRQNEVKLLVLLARTVCVVQQPCLSVFRYIAYFVWYRYSSLIPWHLTSTLPENWPKHGITSWASCQNAHCCTDETTAITDLSTMACYAKVVLNFTVDENIARR